MGAVLDRKNQMHLNINLVKEVLCQQIFANNWIGIKDNYKKNKNSRCLKITMKFK